MPKSQKCSRVSVEKTAFLRALRCVLCAVHCVAVSKSNKHSRTHITGTLHVHTCLIGDSITWRPRGRTSTSSAGRHMTLAHCTRGERDLCIVVPAPMQRRTTTRRRRRSWRRRRRWGRSQWQRSVCYAMAAAEKTVKCIKLHATGQTSGFQLTA